MVKRIGVIGGGQLAQMLVQAAAEMPEVELIVQAANANESAAMVTDNLIFGDINNLEVTKQLVQQSDVVTFENEFVDLDALQSLADARACFYPRLDSLRPLLDKYDQRQYFANLGLPVPQFAIAKNESSTYGFPVVLKARRHGYDGQGTHIVKTEEALADLIRSAPPETFLIEEYIPFERELAVMAARSVSGEVAIFPVVETVQVDEVCRHVFAPAEIRSVVAETVSETATTLLNALDMVGIIGIEFFLTSDGQVLINEIAPRTHNSGHYTIDACNVSQFEMHLRAISDLPLPTPVLKSQGAVMVNLLGYESAIADYQAQRDQLAKLGAQVTWYGKAEARPGRKLGHATTLMNTASRSVCVNSAQIIENHWYKKSARYIKFSKEIN
ncbi:MAG: 5-(carboxyamino)imidazole ribonucleotide synthase [Cyanobacteria bacterium P01_H01_bin.15]